MRLVFDPAPLVAELAPETLQAALKAALWVTANGAEAATITGHAEPAKAAEALAENRTGGGAVVRIGAGGCWIATPGQPARHIPGHPAAAVDTNGAGDAHIGAFIAMLAKGNRPTRPPPSPTSPLRFPQKQKGRPRPGPCNRPADHGLRPPRQPGGYPMKTLALSTALALVAQSPLPMKSAS